MKTATILIRYPNRSDIIYRPYMENDAIWETDDIDTMQEKLNELIYKYPGELITPIHSLKYLFESNVEDFSSDDDDGLPDGDEIVWEDIK